jgi:hypothetical protein
MCRKCLKTYMPQRGSTCLEKGCYFLNWVACSSCGETDAPVAVDREANGGDGVKETESITFSHVCSSCQHVVARHEYTFAVEGEFQNFEMACGLCGSAQHEASVDVFDPRLAPDPLLLD